MGRRCAADRLPMGRAVSIGIGRGASIRIEVARAASGEHRQSVFRTEKHQSPKRIVASMAAPGSGTAHICFNHAGIAAQLREPQRLALVRKTAIFWGHWRGAIGCARARSNCGQVQRPGLGHREGPRAWSNVGSRPELRDFMAKLLPTVRFQKA